MVILDSGFCVLKGIVDLKKNGVYMSALIKKRRYWLKYIHGEDIKSHFADKEVGATDAWAGKSDGVPFHIYTMKEPDYIMSLMSTYGTNQQIDGKETQRDWKENGVSKTTMFKYPEVIDNHFRYCQSVNDHNASDTAQLAWRLFGQQNDGLTVCLLFFCLSQKSTAGWQSATSPSEKQPVCLISGRKWPLS